jgi:hypothetical protein
MGTGLRIFMVDWLDTVLINGDEWDEFRVSIYVPPGISPPPNYRPPNGPPGSHQHPLSGTVSSGRPIQSAANKFQRGIKRDKGHYTFFKDEKQWDEWKRCAIATAYSHGCENILSPHYVPSEVEEAVLFAEQQKFMYDVWNTALKTTMGKHIVRLNEGTRDAGIEIEDLMSTLRTLRLNPTYKGTTADFILKKYMLHNAISPLKVFQGIKCSKQIVVAKEKNAIQYDKYVSLVQSL